MPVRNAQSRTLTEELYKSCIFVEWGVTEREMREAQKRRQIENEREQESWLPIGGEARDFLFWGSERLLLLLLGL